jgi:hypothetical protein
VGDWKDNKRQGKGVFTWSDESSYDGDWENDTRYLHFIQSRGTICFPSLLVILNVDMAEGFFALEMDLCMTAYGLTTIWTDEAHVVFRTDKNTMGHSSTG